jgi:hypothetical protein
MQFASDSVFQTSGPRSHATDLAWQVTKTRQSDGTSVIVPRAYCDNMFGCHPDSVTAVADFKDFVRGSH